MSTIVFIVISIAVLLMAAVCLIFVRKYLSWLTDRRIASFQSDLITKHCDEVQNIYRQMRGWQHDYHNHIQALKAHLALNQTAELSEYLGKLDTDLSSVDTVLKSGNVMVDAILNSKLSLAAAKKINVIAKATVPERLDISEIDLCVIIGNLLDNAMEACTVHRHMQMHMPMQMPRHEHKNMTDTQPYIRVYIGTLKSQLYISVTNSVSGEIKKIGRKYLSTKGTPTHGFGLLRIDRIAEKYKGYVNRQNEEGVFATEIMLPFKAN